MTVSAPVQQFVAKDQPFDPKPFLETHRALTACAREFTRLSDDLVQGVLSLHAASGEEAPVVRRSPGRCIVQLGPVAITVTWLCRNLDPIENGELLVIVWRGAVAPHREQCPERAPTRRPANTAIALWERTLTPVAESEATWSWRSVGVGLGGYSSKELAAHCVERLRRAHAQCCAR